MGQPSVGTVVVIRFPFSDLKGSKLRPALVVAKAEFDNLILCQITSKPYSSKIAVPIEKKDFQSGQLPLTSYVRPDKIFTADQSIISTTVGDLKPAVLKNILHNVTALFIAA